MNPDRLLAWYFRQREKRESPQSVSVSRGDPMSQEARDAREEAYLLALGILGRLQRQGHIDGRDLLVLEAYYLCLGNEHRMVLRNWGETSCSAEDMQSWVSWRKVAQLCGLANGRSARLVWTQARTMFAGALRDFEWKV